MISVDEAQAAVWDRVPILPPESVPLEDCVSRVLRAAARADRDQPPFHRAAMDGFAVRSEDTAGPGAALKIAGAIRAGQWPDRKVGRGEAVRIMTGAPVPEGADAVVQVERTVERSASDGHEVWVETSVQAGQNIVPRGSEARAGATLLPMGVRLGSAQLAVLAAAGVVEPQVSRPPRVAVIVTGDEVIDPARLPKAAQIRNANGPALVSAIQAAGGRAVSQVIVPDDRDATRAAIEGALGEGCDAIVLSGGVSAGDFDFVEDVLGRLGVALHVTAVRVKPGAPFVFGTRGDALFFGLPGNPVSAQVTFELFVRPALLKMQGATRFVHPHLDAILAGPLTNRSARRNYLPVTLTRDALGLRAQPVLTQGSGDISAHARAHALAILEPDTHALAAGDRVSIYPLPPFLEA